MASKRPEHQAPPEIFYNDQEARKYSQNSRMIEIQMQMAERAIELLALPENQPSYVLDLGCGSGLSGQALTEAGHNWVGVDISRSMLAVACEREVEGDLFIWDMGEGLGFKPGAFDGAISVSALQWLCNADRKDHHPPRRLHSFFSSLYACLSRGARAVFQFYPENPAQMELITEQAMKAGFTGGVVIDYPNSTKAKKMFLCLFTGGAPTSMPQGLGAGVEDATCVDVARNTRQKYGKGRSRAPLKSKEWVMSKKERKRKQGKEVKQDSKYSGRRRKPRF